jgi:hypothetical protein
MLIKIIYMDGCSDTFICIVSKRRTAAAAQMLENESALYPAHLIF